MDTSIIYMIAFFVVGVFFGIVMGIISNNQIVNQLTEENAQLRDELKNAKKIERIEILDRSSIEAGDLFKPF